MSLLDEINNVVASILSINGILGAILTDKSGEIICAQMPPIYDNDCQMKLSNRLVNTLGTIAEMNLRCNNLAYYYNDCRIYVDDLKNGYIFVLSSPVVSIQLLAVSSRMWCKKLTDILATS